MYTKTVNVDLAVDLAMLPAHLADRLRRINARTVEVDQNRILFTGGLFGSGGNRWGVLIPFGFGDLTVDSNTRQLRYRLSFRQLVVVATIMVGILAGFGYVIHSSAWLISAAIAWVWLVGLNLFIGLPRFNKFVHSAIDTAPRNSTET
jgi:hypothetical protein